MSDLTDWETVDEAQEIIEQQQLEIEELKNNYEKLTQKAQARYKEPYQRELKRANELAARVERLRNEINITVLDAVHQYNDENNGYWIITQKQLEALKEVDDQSPQTSLAEVKAQAAKDGVIAAALSLDAVKPERHLSYADGHEYGYYVAYQLVFGFADKCANKIRNGKDCE